MSKLSLEQLFVPSLRNSVAIHLVHLEILQCDIYLTPLDTAATVREVLSKRPMKHIIVPELKDWLTSEFARPFPYEKTFEDARYETFVVLHTSGSTGVPKLVEVTHGTMATQDSFQAIHTQGAPPTILEFFKNIRMHVAIPLSHGAAYFCFFPASVYYGMTSVIVPIVPPTAEIVDKVLRYGDVQACCAPPSILVDISKNPAYLWSVKGLKFVMYGGGPLPKLAGDTIRKETGTSILSLLGSTELMLLPLEISAQEDWDYHRFSPCLGAEFRHWRAELYELVIVRNSKLGLSQAAFATFPSLQEFSTCDLYSEHPSKKDFWRYSGRIDDVIVFLSGAKLNPITMEGIIESHKEVNSALIFGTSRVLSGILLEMKQPPSSEKEAARLLESIWPSIELANESCPIQGVLLKGMIIFTNPQKPMARAGKGTVQRKNTLRLYEEEIGTLYGSI